MNQKLLLAGDIGGTKTLLALAQAPDEARSGIFVFERRYPSRDYADFAELLERFLEDARATLGQAPRLSAACLGVAGPITGQRVKVTYLPWTLDAGALGRRFGLGKVRLVNDFAAAASGIPHLPRDRLVTLQAGKPDPGAPRVAIGAGTGLGVAALVGEGDDLRVLAGEGGHIGFAPADGAQLELWRYLHRLHGRVSAERVISGPGLAAIYRFLVQRAGDDADPALLAADDPSAAIAEAALGRNDPRALRALDLFIAAYGAFAGDLALAYLARGGVYLAGGIAPKILPRLAAGGFSRAFGDKGEHAALMPDFPVHVVTDEKLGLRGAAASAASL